MILRNHTGLSRFLGLCATLCLFAVLLGCQQAPAGSAGSSDSTGSSDSIQTPESTAGSASSGSTGSANTADTGGLPDSGRVDKYLMSSYYIKIYYDAAGGRIAAVECGSY